MSATGEVRRRAAPDGFTLLEVLVVIAVLALVTGLVFPRVDRVLASVQFASAKSMVEAAASGARAEAMRTATPVTLQAAGDGRSLLSNGRVIATLPPSVRVQVSPTGPRFYGDGSASGGTLDVVSDRRRAALLVADGTGGVRWQQ